jgi:hypothetical protein
MTCLQMNSGPIYIAFHVNRQGFPEPTEDGMALTLSRLVSWPSCFGIKYQPFANWLQKRHRQSKPSARPSDTVRWPEAVVQEDP